MEDWIEDKLRAIRLIGEEPLDLVAAVHDGLTLQQYMKQNPELFLAGKRRRQAKRDADGAPQPPADPPEHASLEDQNRILREQVAAHREREKALQKELRTLKQAYARLERAFRNLKRLVNRLDQDGKAAA
ncbi:MAG: hypothetical protein ACODAQ_12170 [Phycisphaeraceae bacterium]